MPDENRGVLYLMPIRTAFSATEFAIVLFGIGFSLRIRGTKANTAAFLEGTKWQALSAADEYDDPIRAFTSQKVHGKFASG